MTFYKIFKWGNFVTCPGELPKTPQLKIWRYCKKYRKDKLELDFCIFKQWIHFTFYISKPK
jgi:hypothetical protein